MAYTPKDNMNNEKKNVTNKYQKFSDFAGGWEKYKKYLSANGLLSMDVGLGDCNTPAHKESPRDP